MLFRINSTASNNSLERVPPTQGWPREDELENYLINPAEDGIRAMSESVFGEPLLLISNQVRTSAKKRADILALDRSGNGVIIELKRDAGRMGIETQALQYLADFSNYRGESFIKKYGSEIKDTIMGFLGDRASIDKINHRSRIILVAQSFDETLFSMGEWLCSKDVAFRCISYTPFRVSNEQYLSFSVAFDRSPEAVFHLSFSSSAREPGIYWHNIARAEDDWWHFLVANSQIPACFQGIAGDQGEKVLTKYVAGDQVVAYSKGFGAVGWGTIEDPKSYQLLPIGHREDIKNGDCRHRLNIKWSATAENLRDGLSAEEIRRDFNIYHPISTSVSMNKEGGANLIKRLTARFYRARK